MLDGLYEGRSGIRTMPEWDFIKNLRTRLGGEVTGVDESRIPRKYRRTMGRLAIMSGCAMSDALADAGLSGEDVAGPRCGVSFGSSAGSTIAQDAQLEQFWQSRDLMGVTASPYLQIMPHTCAANLALMFSTRGPVVASCTACTAGSQGVGYGFEQVAMGNADVMLCGGAEELHYMAAMVFDVMRATSSHYNTEPDRSPRPFDRDRDGLVVGEGAGALVLEEYERATHRGATIHAEILAFATNSDGSHITTASPEGVAECIRESLARARLNASDIDYVNAHATATPIGDRAEGRATHSVFGADVPVSSVKGHMGHTLGAAGAIESIATIAMMNGGAAAQTRNLEAPDPEIAPLDHVMGEPRELRMDTAMCNNFAFGGINTSLIFRKV